MEITNGILVVVIGFVTLVFQLLFERFIGKWSKFHDAWLEETIKHNQVYERQCNSEALNRMAQEMLTKALKLNKKSKIKATKKATKKVTKK